MKIYRMWYLLISLVVFISCTPHKGYVQQIEDSWFVRSEGAPWGLLLPVTGLNKVDEKRSVDGKYVYAHFSKSNWNISMFIEPVNGYCNNSVDCAAREKIEKDPSIKSSKFVKTYIHDKFTVVEYFLENYPPGLPAVSGAQVGDKINQLNMSALLFRDGYWVDLHISFMPAHEGNIETVTNSFKTILEKIKIVKQKV